MDVKMKKSLHVLIGLIIVSFATQYSIMAIADELSADTLHKGCSLIFENVEPGTIVPTNDGRNFETQMSFKCEGSNQSLIDTLDSEGGGPEIVTVFYRKNQIVLLLRWGSSNPVADLQGYIYAVYAYDLKDKNGKISFVKRDDITKAFGDGYDGTMNGKEVHFKYKDAASIRARLRVLGLRPG